MQPKIRPTQPQSAGLPELRKSGGSQKTILVVDKDEGIRDLAVDVLRKPDRRILEASDGSQALKLIDENRVDVLVADNDLSDYPGNTFFDGVKYASPGTRILAATRDPSYSQQDFKSSSADDWIRKPFEVEELNAKVGRLENLGRQKV
ncbi:MAG: response regulator [Candidatus Altiarchaeales archaeon]|nr:response regulator [Candidatus Altiarchaeales archaeon]